MSLALVHKYVKRYLLLKNFSVFIYKFYVFTFNMNVENYSSYNNRKFNCADLFYKSLRMPVKFVQMFDCSSSIILHYHKDSFIFGLEKRYDLKFLNKTLYPVKIVAVLLSAFVNI